jgi:diacylglycerol kinase family enzyme
MTVARHLLVANPTAQSGKNAARIARARELLDAAGLHHRLVPTAPHGGTVTAVARELADPDLQVAIYMGGDGTFAEVAKGILQSGRAGQVALGMLPTGTANDQGKSFGLSSEESALPANVRVLAEGARCRLDVGRIQALDRQGALLREDLFFDSAGWGLSPRTLALRNEDREVIGRIPVVREVYRDHLVYAGALLRTFLASYVDDDKFDALVLADDQVQEWRGLTDLVVKGTRIYGGMWIFDPTSKPDDGLFEVLPFVGRRDWASKVLVHLEQSGTLSEGLAAAGVTHSQGVRAARIEIELRGHSPRVPLAAQIDGEEFPASERVRIEVLPRALQLVVPREHAGA